jgi:hypothetical protein
VKAAGKLAVKAAGKLAVRRISMRIPSTSHTIAALALAAAACANKSDRAPMAAEADLKSRAMREESRSGASGASVAAEMAMPPAPAAEKTRDGLVADEGGADRRKQAKDAPDPGDAGKGGGGAAHGKRPESTTRAWFPETFLFEPLVVTDDTGAAVVPVRVPDRLTTWRVLALAHSRSGAQGGAVASFLGTLPTYVDPVVPAFLLQGDEVRLPIQLVNTTAKDVTATLEVSARNATIAGAGGAAGSAAAGGGAAGRGPRTVPAQGSTLDAVTLIADHPGRVQLHVALGGTDAVERGFDVRPTGRPVTETHSGTLAAPRSFATAGTPGADPSTDHVRLRVFPGALALLRSELAMSSGRAELSDDAYALLLAGRAPRLLAALGDKPDLAALRELSIVTGQRAIRAARTLDVQRATLLAEPALAHPENPVLARLGERAAAYLAENQRPDGTFDGGTGWTLQRLLVVTAAATRAAAADTTAEPARQRALGVQARSAGVFARSADQVRDGYTAAAMLASGAISGELTETLRKRVRDAIKPTPDGAAYLAVDDGVVRGDGAIPDRIEATALAVLALQGDPPAVLADLGTTLLGAYSIERGWGDGYVNLVAMQAILALFKDPLPPSVTVTLALDGAPILHGTLEGARLHDVLALDGPVPAGLAAGHRWTVTAEPAVPGLGYALALDSFVPWDKQAIHDGLELAVPAHVDAVVGKPSDMALTAIAPAGLALHIQQALPAGVQVDTPSLQAAVTAGTLQRFVAADGTLDLYVPPLSPGKTFALTYRLIPTLAGVLHTGASLLEVGTAQFRVPPAEWLIK